MSVFEMVGRCRGDMGGWLHVSERGRGHAYA